MRGFVIAVLIVFGLPIAAAVYGFIEARHMPVLREAKISLPDWPSGEKPITAVLIADIHLGNTAMGAGRLREIVAQINALKPDLVLIAGDFIFGHEADMAARLGPDLTVALASLRARMGIIAVLGNHDVETGAPAVLRALDRAHISVLQNDAVRRGPITIVGIADYEMKQSDVARAYDHVDGLGGARVVLSHSPDVDDELPKGATLLLAGHSHCGQVRLPWYGPLVWVTRDRESCGLMHKKKDLTVIVTAGLGTSGLPIRLGAPPDLWLLHLGPEQQTPGRAP